MKVLISFLVGAALVSYATLNIQQAAEPWAPKIMNMCLNPANSDTSGNLRVAYTGISNTLDRIICFYVNFNQQPLHDILGAPLMRLMMGAFGTSYAIMAFEGSRRGFKKTTLLAAFPLFGLLANFVGIFSVFSLLWIPMDLYYRGKKKDTSDWNITLPEAYGTLAGIVLGYGIPSAILASPLVKDDSSFEQDFICIWIVLPMIIIPFINVCIKFFKNQGSSIDQVRDPAFKERLYVAEGKDALERSFLFLGVLNMLNHFVNFWIVGQKGIRIWDSILLLLGAPGNLPADLTFGDLGQLLGTRTLLIDYIALSVGFVLWAVFNSGIFAGIMVILLTPIVGPAAAVSYYAYYRENKIQNIASAKTETEKAAGAAVAASSNRKKK
ncbi:hypothetical protein [Parasitella parasitica]|uniref:Uncharacterized protein n=1 Tax=Parasitella parasitica TaxID=35722 RepID=A0A0B7NDC2_9FUNG|nr:hypothetical protein [Parasitella parasitica]